MPELSSPTQEFVDIKQIKDGVLYLKSGAIRKVLIVSGVNFDLKSDDEQNLILNMFQNMLNALDFSIQFFIHSRKVNVEAYLKSMALRKEKEPNELLRIQISEYIEFIRSFVAQNEIIDKAFFCIVPYEPITLESKTNSLLNMLQKSPTKESPEQTLKNNLEQLEHRVNQIIDGLEQIGLRVVPLNDEELTELFYNLYNPQLVEKEVTKRTA